MGRHVEQAHEVFDDVGKAGHSLAGQLVREEIIPVRFVEYDYRVATAVFGRKVEPVLYFLEFGDAYDSAKPGAEQGLYNGFSRPSRFARPDGA